jgi:hypothetical protein
MKTLWRRKRPVETPDEAPKLPQQQLDPFVAEQLSRPESLGAYFPPSHQGAFIKRDSDE